ncbi:juvenile hormone acid O-methyltransferase-like isoform X2 [Tachypleus tridentatus]|uniref:juvenile hormone acid O-methyltransferase-like isoform X2 n=1 Tax=Tachypleus tridentatus TaxID=6853 RepID=UPI003FD31EC8
MNNRRRQTRKDPRESLSLLCCPKYSTPWWWIQDYRFTKNILIFISVGFPYPSKQGGLQTRPDRMNSKPSQYVSNRSKADVDWIQSRLSHYVSQMTWSNEEVVLDFGCGSGHVTKDVLLSHCTNLAKIIALDVQPATVDYAKQTFHHEKIEYMTLNIMERTPQNWEKMFDKIFSFFSFHFVKDCRKFLNTVHCLLKRGGYFLVLGVASIPPFYVWSEMSTMEQWKDYFKDIDKHIPATHLWNNPCGEFIKLAKECGFHPITITSGSAVSFYGSKKGFLDFYESTLPEEIIKQIPKRLLEKFWEDTWLLFLKHGVYCESDGTVFSPYTNFEMYLQSKN